MQGRNPIFAARNALAITILSVALNGCLSQEESAPEETLVEETLSDHVLTGSVGDGPIVGAKVRVLAKDGTMLAELESDGSAGYTVTVRTKGKYYPLTIDARNGVDIVTKLIPDFDLFGAALEPGKKSVANVNPFSTFAYELARDMGGGISKNNLTSAQAVVSEALNSGLSTLVETGPMGTAIGTTNIAEIIKASETLGELVRRIRDLQQMHNRPASGNSVIRAVASDLTDGVIDGRGGSRVEPRVAALAVVTAVPVLLESMQNELHVNGQDATGAMMEAMNQVSKGNVTTTIGDLTVTAQMLNAMRIGLDALLATVPNAKLQELHDAADNLQAGMDSLSIRAAIPRDYRTTLEQSLVTVAGSDETTIATINTVSRDGGVDPDPVNNPPTISGTPASSVDAGNEYAFTPTASDAEGNALSFSIANQPPWASFDTSTGTLSGTPSNEDAGTYSDITISVSDGELSASLAAFSITVNAVTVNTAPQISGTPASSVDAGNDYSFTPTASDAEGNTLSFTIGNQPPWASFDASTGTLSGTPSNEDAGTHSDITISVSDGEFSASLAAFSITVNAVTVNTAPQISGTPASSVNEGQDYVFTPSASDADADTLTFSVSGLPVWASFDASTGTLSGTPGAGDVGVYSNISITVSDGQASATLGPFDITVDAISLGSATLSWTAPTQNEDGTTLTDLAGYKLYWGTTPGNYTESVTIENASVLTYVVENLAPGTYEFVATSFNTSGVESRYSGAATKVVP
jgi:hypothetical protein